MIGNGFLQVGSSSEQPLTKSTEKNMYLTLDPPTGQYILKDQSWEPNVEIEYNNSDKTKSQVFSHNIKKMILYSMTFVISISFADFMKRIFDTMTTKTGDHHMSLAWNGFYVFLMFGLTLFLVWIFNMNLK
jgi:hypothetical protein